MQGDLITIEAICQRDQTTIFFFFDQYYVKWEFNTKSFFVGTRHCG